MVGMNSIGKILYALHQILYYSLVYTLKIQLPIHLLHQTQAFEYLTKNLENNSKFFLNLNTEK